MDFSKMSGWDWAKFLVNHPEHADKRNWSKLAVEDWPYRAWRLER